jgi:hypothetical protein
MPQILENEREEILRPGKIKWTLMLLLSAAFVGAGFFLLPRSDPWSDRFMIEACIGFFSLCGIVALIQFAPGSSFLRLTPDGVTVRTVWRTWFYRWSDIERFGVAEFPAAGQSHRRVGFDFSDGYVGRNRQPKWKDFNRNLCGFEATGPDSYGWSHADLAMHLNEWRERYAGEGGGTAR